MTPSEWLKLLIPELDKRATAVQEARDWYDGNHPIPLPPPNTAASVDREAAVAFQQMQELSITNFLAPVVDMVAKKIRVEGFRSSKSPTGTDVDLWDMWKRNHLTTDWKANTLEAVKVGNSAAIVWPGKDGKAVITVEDPSQVIVAYAAGSRHERAAALKRWVDEDGYTRLNLFLPDGIYKFRSRSKAESTLVLPGASPEGTWERFQPADEAWPLVNKWKVVPVPELRANAPLGARRFGGGVPQFQKQITTQRRINHTTFGRLVTMEHQSYRQRWATNWDVPMNADGSAVDRVAMMKMSAARIANFAPRDPEAEVRLGEFAQSDFRPFIDANQEEAKHIATSSGTPPYAFLLGDMINVAADALARIEGVHIAVVADAADDFDGATVETLKLALRMEGDPRADDPSLSVAWKEFEQRTATEQLAIAQKYKDLGAPDEVVFAAMPDCDQAQASRLARQVTGQRLLAAASAPARATV